MFRHSKIPWDELLVASVRVILRHYGLTSGHLVVDDGPKPTLTLLANSKKHPLGTQQGT
jgi:hypothetical protein